jgi:glycosyltransferase involved in cell wall biosynthesis
MITAPVTRQRPIQKLDRKIKLFVDARWLAQPGQGVYTYLCEVYRRLSLDHTDAFEICYGCVGDAVPDFLSHSDRVLTYASDSLAWRYLMLGMEINRAGIDVAHFQYYLPRGLHTPVKTVVSIHDLIFMREKDLFPLTYSFPRSLLFRDAASRARRVITISEQSRDDLVNYFKLSNIKIELIHLGMDTALTEAIPAPMSGFSPGSYLLTVGRHEPRKNYKRLVEAYVRSDIYERMGIQLVIAGWYSLQFDNELLSVPGLALLPDCTNEQLAWLYRNARGFVFASIAEGYGLPVAEALSFSLPVAVSNTYPVPSLKARAICVFDPYSITEMAHAINTLASTASKGTLVTQAMWNWDDCATAHRNTLIDLVNLNRTSIVRQDCEKRHIIVGRR